jgi:gas vesicle protein
MGMNYEHDGPQMGNGGGGFVVGLLAGAAIGAGIGMLLAPKSGAELREQLSGRANDLAEKASEQYRRATGVASDLAERGREMYGTARDAVNRGTEEAQRYVRQTTETMSDEMGSTDMPSGRGSRS